MGLDDLSQGRHLSISCSTCVEMKAVLRMFTVTQRMWESQSSRSKHFSPTLFSSREVKVFCILMRISDAQRSHPESFTIRREDICLFQNTIGNCCLCYSASYFLALCPSIQSTAHLSIMTNNKNIHSSQRFQHICNLQTLEINVSVEWQKISICALPFRKAERSS